MSFITDAVLGNDGQSPASGTKPFYKVKNKNKKERLDWLTASVNSLVRSASVRTRSQRDNLNLYRGVNIQKMDRNRDQVHRGKRLNKMQKFVIPHIHDLTETRVAQIMRLKPAVEVLPNNDEWQDRASAKVVKSIIDHIWEINTIDYTVQKMHRHARIFGESYLWCDWDKDKGDLRPEYVAARDSGFEALTLDDGSEIKLDSKIMEDLKMTGDVRYKLELPWRVYLQRKQCMEEVEYVFRALIIQTDVARDRWSNKNIQPTQDLKVFDMEDMHEEFLEEHTLVWEFTHVKNKQVEEGSQIFFTADEILEEGDHPFNHGKLPFVRLTDLDVPDKLNGVSKYELVASTFNMYNNLSTLIAKNIWLMGHAKWMMPRGAAKIEQLGNDNTIVQYQGAVAPQMIQVSPNPPEAYSFRDSLKQEGQLIYGSHGISRGQVPKGISAASALQFLNELENDRATNDIAKHSFLVRDIAKMTAAIAGDMYDPEDGRMVRIVGENNKFLIRHFDASHLHKSYDIQINNSSGLPELKSAKIQRAMDALQRHPGLMTGKEWARVIELGDYDKVLNIKTAALQAAESENEDLMAGRVVMEPEEWEDHITHWDLHVSRMQSRQFKEEGDVKARAAYRDHLYWTEELMIDKAELNPEFEAQLASLVNFPIFPHENYVPARSREHQQAVVQGQANKQGQEVLGNQIPAALPEER